MKLSALIVCLPALAYAASLDARRPVCSGEGGKCDTGLFECCTNDPYLYCDNYKCVRSVNLQARRPACSREGGKCDVGYFECCSGPDWNLACDNNKCVVNHR